MDSFYDKRKSAPSF